MSGPRPQVRHVHESQVRNYSSFALLGLSIAAATGCVTDSIVSVRGVVVTPASAFRFLYHVTLGLDAVASGVPAAGHGCEPHLLN